jgi:hypothetical protein
MINYIKRTCNFRLFAIGALVAFIMPACDKGFEEMNKNPNAFTEPVIGSLFSATIVRHAGVGDGNTLYPNSKQAGSFVQYFSSLNAFQWTGVKYLYQGKADYNNGLWNTAFNTELKETQQIINLTKGKTDMINQYNIARIWRVQILHRVTDMYGDMPYSEAASGLNGIYKPKYDKQVDIYADMLKELEEAAKALDATKASYGTADFVYGGAPAKWKTFAYSLMLRLGMRMTKVDPAKAELWVKKAIAGGVMQSNADIAKLAHTSASGTNWNWDSRQLQTAEGVPPSAQGRGFSKLNKTLIDHLQATKDPRLPFYATLWRGNISISELAENSDPAKQKGLPGDYDYTTIANLIPNWNADMQRDFSEINIHTIAHLDAPTTFQSYAEVEYLLAEAALRGWGPGTAKEHYEKGVTAHLAATSLYPNAALSIPDAASAAASYLAANPYNATATFNEQMRQIHTQVWVSLFGQMNNIESFANWRRTGYPVLIPTNYPGNETGGVIQRRLRYPDAEAALNTVNYNAAIAAQGPDLFLTRIWWDKQ